jgi:nucleoside-diphosphate-sugar epimerase
MEDDMSDEIVVFGYGAVGRVATDLLTRKGFTVRVAQRREPTMLPAGATFTCCDILDASSVTNAVDSARQLVMAIGFAYEGSTWRASWPRAMANLLAACEVARARLLFVDNLYMCGPQQEPLREDMPLADYGIKPAVSAAITRQWQTAHRAGRVKVAALRAPDFYGPEVSLSHLGDVGFGALAKGKRVTLIAPPDTPHDFAYVPDIGRGVVSLVEAPDEDYGQAWHIPCAPTRTPREILALGAAALGVPLRIVALPLWLLPAVGLGIPLMREMAEMRFQWDRPYYVDARKFSAQFWSDATPFEVGAPAAALSFRKKE